MRGVFDFVRVIANSESTVLITGESGTGKEMIANLVHHSSSRRHRPFVAVSCAILSETLIESELFGHERGAFTNAIKERPGRFELADGGTLFLDDIDDVPWKDDLVTEPPRIQNGHLIVPTKPGWGADVNEAAVRKHAPK